MNDEVTKIHPLCPKCGKQLHIELPGYDRLRKENMQLRGELWTLKHRDDPITPEWFEKMIRGGL